MASTSSRVELVGGGRRDSDSDGWVTDDEDLLHVEVSGALDLGRRRRGSVTKFVGLDSAEPLVQIGNQAFVGRYEATAGTSVFLEVVPRDEDDQTRLKEGDPVFSPKPANEVIYHRKADKKLILKRVFLNERPQEPAISQPPSPNAKEGSHLGKSAASSSLSPSNEPDQRH